MSAILREASEDLASSLTVLTCGKSMSLAKRWLADGTIAAYDGPRNYRVRSVPVGDIHALSEVLTRLEGAPHSCVIRGEFVGDERAQGIEPPERPGHYRRLLTLFDDVPRTWFCVDVDNYEPLLADPVAQPEMAVGEFIQDCLPDAFQGVTCHWQLSNSAGAPGKDATLKAHVWFCADRALTSAQLRAWAHGLGRHVDVALYNAVQIHYTSAPLFDDGVADPVPQRSGLLEGWMGDTVAVELPELVVVDGDAESAGRSSGDYSITDPRTKEGLVGSFCATFSIEEAIERWLSDQFEHATGSRWTWLLGGGTPEGAFITDDGLHMVNKHNTAPGKDATGKPRALNAFDLVRTHLFADADAAWLAEREASGDWTPVELRDLPSSGLMRDLAEAALREATAEARLAAVQAYQSKLAAATDYVQVTEVIAREVARDDLVDEVGREVLAGAIRDRLRALGAAISITQVRGLVKPTPAHVAPAASAPVVGAGPAAAQAGGAWLEPWTYVSGLDRFYNTSTKATLTLQGFNLTYNRLVLTDAHGDPMPPAVWATSVAQLPVVYRLEYVPYLGPTFAIDGQDCANLYRPESVPSTPSSLSVEDLEAIGWLERHIAMLVPMAGERDDLLDWMAFQVQHPGRKVLWAPVIKGVQGDGKSLLGSMLSAAMGGENVREIAAATIESSPFTGWATGQCVGVIEELKLQGHNRHDVVNKLKPLITNERIEIHAKGRDPYTALNTTNYLVLTNHSDALPMDEHDRRYAAFFSPWASILELERAVTAQGLDMVDYWEQTWAAIRKRPGAVRLWLLGRDLSRFNPHARAPLTQHRELMIEAAMADDEQIIRDIIAEGTEGVAEGVLCVSYLMAEYKMRSGGDTLPGRRISTILGAMGYKRIGRSKWGGVLQRFWARWDVNVSAKAAITMLSSTLEKCSVETDG